MSVNEHLEALEAEKARLENALVHLERSNVDLAEALLAGPDKDFQEAIAENKRVVADYQEKVYKLSVEIAGIKGDTAESHSGEGSGGAATAASGGDDGQWL